MGHMHIRFFPGKTKWSGIGVAIYWTSNGALETILSCGSLFFPACQWRS